jgi:hypothetical protein
VTRLARACREIVSGPGQRALAQRVRRRAWQLAGIAYERFASALAQQVAAGKVKDGEIDSWEPKELSSK